MTEISDGRTTDEGTGWGPWRLNVDTLSLVALDPRTGAWHYEVDLERALTSAETLDWIYQVAGKGWADDVTIAGLVRAINDVLHPQANLCSLGTPKSLDAATVLRLAQKAALKWPGMVEKERKA